MTTTKTKISSRSMITIAMMIIFVSGVSALSFLQPSQIPQGKYGYFITCRNVDQLKGNEEELSLSLSLSNQYWVQSHENQEDRFSVWRINKQELLASGDLNSSPSSSHELVLSGIKITKHLSRVHPVLVYEYHSGEQKQIQIYQWDQQRKKLGGWNINHEIDTSMEIESQQQSLDGSFAQYQWIDLYSTPQRILWSNQTEMESWFMVSPKGQMYQRSSHDGSFQTKRIASAVVDGNHSLLKSTRGVSQSPSFYLPCLVFVNETITLETHPDLWKRKNVIRIYSNTVSPSSSKETIQWKYYPKEHLLEWFRCDITDKRKQIDLFVTGDCEGSESTTTTTCDYFVKSYTSPDEFQDCSSLETSAQGIQDVVSFPFPIQGAGAGADTIEMNQPTPSSTPTRSNTRTPTATAIPSPIPSQTPTVIAYPTCSPPETDSLSCVDCQGRINGTMVLDVCGICGGNGTLCFDCRGIFHGSTTLDVCGICGGNGRSCLDCRNKPFGTAAFDVCGVCEGNGKSCLDCNQVPFGTSVIDLCGVCGGDNSSCLLNQTVNINAILNAAVNTTTTTDDLPGVGDASDIVFAAGFLLVTSVLSGLMTFSISA